MKKRLKNRTQAKGRRVLFRTGMIVGLTTVFCISGSLVLTGAFITGLAERFGRPPMKPPQ